MAKYIKEIARKLMDGSYENIAIGAKAENVITSHDITAEQILNESDIYDIEITVDKWVEGYDEFGTEIIIQDSEYTWEEILNKNIINLHFYAVDWGTNATNYFRREEGYSDLSNIIFVHRTLNWSSNEVMTHYLSASLSEPYKFNFHIHRYEPATRLSAFNNDTNFITNTVDNLTNYYKKTETYTQEEVNSLLNTITTLDIQVITAFPENPNKTTIYLKGTGTDGDNDYEEWLYTDSGWELIGTTAVDLSDYLKTTGGTITGDIEMKALLKGGGYHHNKVDLTHEVSLQSENAEVNGGYKVTVNSLEGVTVYDTTGSTDAKLFSIQYSQGLNNYNNKIVNVKDPVNAQDAATKNYVDNLLSNVGGSDLELVDPQPYEEIV